LFTQARAEAQKLQDLRKFHSYRHCLRDTIFGVRTKNLRTELISFERKFHALKLRSFQDDLSEARKRLNDAGIPEHYSSFFAGAGGAVIALLAWKFGGTMGGTAAAVFAVITALCCLHELEWVRSRNVERSTTEVAHAEATVNEIVEQEVFISGGRGQWRARRGIYSR
jgi:hypothetical protein